MYFSVAYLFSKEKSSCFFLFLQISSGELTDNARNCSAIKKVDEQRIKESIFLCVSF